MLWWMFTDERCCEFQTQLDWGLMVALCFNLKLLHFGLFSLCCWWWFSVLLLSEFILKSPEACFISSSDSELAPSESCELCSTDFKLGVAELLEAPEPPVNGLTRGFGCPGCFSWWSASLTGTTVNCFSDELFVVDEAGLTLLLLIFATAVMVVCGVSATFWFNIGV